MDLRISNYDIWYTIDTCSTICPPQFSLIQHLPWDQSYTMANQEVQKDKVFRLKFIVQWENKYRYLKELILSKSYIYLNIHWKFFKYQEFLKQQEKKIWENRCVNLHMLIDV